MKIVIWDILTILVVLAIAGLGGFLGLIFIDPNVPFNPFPPPTLPAVVQLPSSTPTPRGLQATWTVNPDKYENTLRPTVTLTPSITPSASITISPTATVSQTASLTYTVTGTPPTDTPTPTRTRTATATLNAYKLTSAAKTQFAEQTSDAKAAKTEAAAETRAAQTEAAAGAKLTQNAINLTLTQSVINVTLTAMQHVYESQTAAAPATETHVAGVTATAAAVIQTQVWQMEQAPVAYSDTAGGTITSIKLGDLLSPVQINLNAGGFADTNWGPISGWWVEEPYWYLTFFNYASTATSGRLQRVFYANASVNQQLGVGSGDPDDNRQPVVWPQSGDASARWLAYTHYNGSARDIWRVRGDGSGVQSVTSDITYDDHDPSWTPSGYLLYVHGFGAGPYNIYQLNPDSSPPGSALTGYTGSTTAASPKYCRYYDWTTESWQNRIAFAMSNDPANESWLLFIADPGNWDATYTSIDTIGLLNPGAGDPHPAISWSPYCRKIAYLARDPGNLTAGNIDVYYIDRDGLNKTALTANGTVEDGVSWKPIVSELGPP